MTPTSTDGVISALRDKIRELERERESFGRIAQTEIIRLENDVARLKSENDALHAAFDAVAKPAL